jgi:hypothetical protein
MCSNSGPDASDAARDGRDHARAGSYNTNAYNDDSALRSAYREAHERQQREDHERRGG